MAEQDTGAASSKPDWPKRKQTPEENVRRLQARIVKAEMEGRHNKVKVLQRLLTHSYSGKAIDVERGPLSRAEDEVAGPQGSRPEQLEQALAGRHAEASDRRRRDP